MTGPYDIPVYHARDGNSMRPTSLRWGLIAGSAGAAPALPWELLLMPLRSAVNREPVDVGSRTWCRRGGDALHTRPRTNCTTAATIRNAPGAQKRRSTSREFAGAAAKATETGGRLIGVGMASYTEQSAHGTAEWVARGFLVVFGYEPALARFTAGWQVDPLCRHPEHMGRAWKRPLPRLPPSGTRHFQCRCHRPARRQLGITLGVGTFASRSMTMSGGAVSAPAQDPRGKNRSHRCSSVAGTTGHGRAGRRQSEFRRSERGLCRYRRSCLPASGALAGRRRTGARSQRRLSARARRETRCPMRRMPAPSPSTPVPATSRSSTTSFATTAAPW